MSEADVFMAYLRRMPRDSVLSSLCNDILADEWVLAEDALVPTIEASVALAAAPVLLVWASIRLDALHNRLQSQAAQERIEMIIRLQQDYGYPADKAERLVEKMLKAVAKENRENSAVESIIKLAKVVKDLAPTSILKELLTSSTDSPEEELGDHGRE